MKKILNFIALSILTITITQSKIVWALPTEDFATSNISKAYQLQLDEMFPHAPADTNDGHGC